MYNKTKKTLPNAEDQEQSCLMKACSIGWHQALDIWVMLTACKVAATEYPPPF